VASVSGNARFAVDALDSTPQAHDGTVELAWAICPVKAEAATQSASTKPAFVSPRPMEWYRPLGPDLDLGSRALDR
jgi:hypothetical protein